MYIMCIMCIYTHNIFNPQSFRTSLMIKQRSKRINLNTQIENKYITKLELLKHGDSLL